MSARAGAFTPGLSNSAETDDSDLASPPSGTVAGLSSLFGDPSWQAFVVLGGVLLAEGATLPLFLAILPVFFLYLVSALLVFFAVTVGTELDGVTYAWLAGAASEAAVVTAILFTQPQNGVNGTEVGISAGLAAVGSAVLALGLASVRQDLAEERSSNAREYATSGPEEVLESPTRYDLATAEPIVKSGQPEPKYRWREVERALEREHLQASLRSGAQGPMATDLAGEGDSLEPGSASTDLARLTGEPVLPGERVLEQWSAPGGLGVLTNLRCLLLGHWQLGRRTARWVRELRSIGVVEVVARGALAERGPERGRRGASTGNLNDETFAVLLDNVLVFQGKPGKCEEIQRWITQARTERLRLGPDDLLPLEGPGHSPE